MEKYFVESIVCSGHDSSVSDIINDICHKHNCKFVSITFIGNNPSNDRIYQAVFSFKD